MEIGSFIELQMPKGKEYYGEENIPNMQIARLNSGRAAIWHAFRLTKCNVVWIPYYQCETVRDFLIKKGVCIKYYRIDSEFNPIDLNPSENEAVLLVNYYGIMSFERMKQLSQQYEDVIIDNSQAFFCKPIENCQNVYSCRKFVGVPDGAYVVSKNACVYTDQYEQGYSSDTALFLLQRIEYGCEGKTYASRTVNEERIDNEDIKLMSKLTHRILEGEDWQHNIVKRRENFKLACDMFGDINELNPKMYYGDDCVPMVYPLMITNDKLLPLLIKNKHFQGHWWNYITEILPSSSAEYKLSKYMVPITIDQRYGIEELKYIRGLLYEL